MSKNNKIFQEYEENLRRVLALEEKATDGLKGYSNVLKDIKEVSRNLKQIKSDELKLINEITNTEIRLATLKSKNLKGLSDAEKKKVKADIKNTKALLSASKDGLVFAKKRTEELKRSAKELANSVNSSNLLTASFISLGRGIKGSFIHLKRFSKELAKEMKDVQLTEQSMGLLNQNANAFRLNMYKAATKTAQLGVSTSDLAKMQGSYSEQIGRSVALSEANLIAMSEMAKGTMLGVEGTAEMTSNMDAFGISARGTHDIMSEMMNTSSKMGVNSVKVTANLKKNMVLANKLHFKDGVKGMLRLAVSAAKMRLDMEGIGSMAEKVFRPEGAVEMAAKLQTMGGEFSKLADPFQLMFKARNDFEGFANDIGNATKEFAKFNSESGMFEISGLGFDRIKEIASITGISADKLAEMGRQSAKTQKIEMSSTLNDDNSAFIASIAQFNKTTKKYEIAVNGQDVSIDKLTNAQVKLMHDENKSLKERAKQAQTADETWKNLENTFKSLLLPVLNGFSEAVKGPLHKFMTTFNAKDGWADKLFEMGSSLGTAIIDFVEGVGPFIDTLVTFVKDNPFKAISGLILGTGMFKAAQWIANGVALRIGFGRGGIGGSDVGSFAGRTLKGASKLTGGKNTMVGRGLRNVSASASKFGGMKSVGLGLGLGAASMGADYLRGQRDDQNDSWGKALGVGGTALQYAGMGAMLGPWGALAGGVLGAGVGLYNEYGGASNGDPANQLTISNSQKYDDVIMRSGQAPIAINPADDIMSAKSGGPVDKALSKSGPGGDIKVTFGNSMKIDGSITLNSGENQSEITLDDPILLRDLSNLIQKELSRAINGGKLSPNPA